MTTTETLVLLSRLEMMLPHLTVRHVEVVAQSPYLLSGLVAQFERLITEATDVDYSQR